MENQRPPISAVSSHPGPGEDAPTVARAIRLHWGIENQPGTGTLMSLLAEDASGKGTGHATAKSLHTHRAQ